MQPHLLLSWTLRVTICVWEMSACIPNRKRDGPVPSSSNVELLSLTTTTAIAGAKLNFPGEAIDELPA
jgi:hypothetical protein